MPACAAMFCWLDLRTLLPEVCFKIMSRILFDNRVLLIASLSLIREVRPLRFLLVNFVFFISCYMVYELDGSWLCVDCNCCCLVPVVDDMSGRHVIAHTCTHIQNVSPQPTFEAEDRLWKEIRDECRVILTPG